MGFHGRAMTDTLILDEDGLYDPNQFNDRLLLGLRGTMSEAELHFLRARLDGGKLNKARRGELRTMLPAGLIYDPEGHVQLDPDRQIQQAICKVFEMFERLRSAWQVKASLGRGAGAQAGVGVGRQETAGFEAGLSHVTLLPGYHFVLTDGFVRLPTVHPPNRYVLVEIV